MSDPPDRERERQRQQALLQALWQPSQAPEALAGWLRSPEAALTRRGLQAYGANGSAGAERALAASFPTVQALVGEEAFAGLARACWRAHPPERGDLAWFGQVLPSFIEGDERLVELPYLADCARLDWQVAQAESAADAAGDAQGWPLLSEEDPAALAFVLAPGWAVLRSAWPVATLWQAHHAPDERGFEPAREALQRGEGEAALVWREGWKGLVQRLSPAEAAWCEALADGASIGEALQRAGQGGGFDFEPWLLQGLQRSWVLGVRRL